MKSPLHRAVKVVQDAEDRLLNRKNHGTLHNDPSHGEEAQARPAFVQPSCTGESVLVQYFERDEARREATLRDIDREDKIIECMQLRNGGDLWVLKPGLNECTIDWIMSDVR